MSSQWERKLYEMAGKEQMYLPDSLNRKLEKTFLKIERQAYRPRRTVAFRRTVILSAAMVMLFSITATAAVGAWRERMAAMNQEKLEEYFAQVYTSRLPADNYNRPYLEEERQRMEELTESYEKQGVFPAGELTMLEEAEDYKGKNVGFLKDTSTFFFPEKEMSDEELLQVIDFWHKRDYSLQRMNEMIAAGEAEFPQKPIAPAIGNSEATDTVVLQSDAVTDPGQELTIPYTGDLSLLSMAAGNDCIFLTGWNEVHRMEIGSGDSSLFYDDFDKRTRITALCQDESGDVYLGVMQQNEDGSWDSGIQVLDENGSFLREIDLTPFRSGSDITMAGQRSNGFIRQMAVDGNGFLYLRGIGFEEASLLLVLDREGNLVSHLEAGDYTASITCGIGIGKDGRAWTAIFDEDRRLGIAAVNPREGILEDVHMGIVPDDTVSLDLVTRGYDSDFVFWGYSGIFSWNVGEESATQIMPAWETPCDVEGALCCGLTDGRVVLAASDGHNTVEDTDGTKRGEWIPERTRFYYKSGMRGSENSH